MKVVFMGTPEFAAVSLRKIYEHHEVAAIFTQPDKVNQRGKKIKFSPVKEFAIEKGIDLSKIFNLKLAFESSILLNFNVPSESIKEFLLGISNVNLCILS